MSTPEDQTNIQMPGETTQQFVERRRHTWVVREWIAIACTAALMLVLGIALFHEVPKANEAIVIVNFGVLHGARPGNDYCNGYVAITNGPTFACLVDCVHADDLAELLAVHELDKRPAGK